jgi:hypothetical protein
MRLLTVRNDLFRMIVQSRAGAIGSMERCAER